MIRLLRAFRRSESPSLHFKSPSLHVPDGSAPTSRARPQLCRLLLVNTPAVCCVCSAAKCNSAGCGKSDSVPHCDRQERGAPVAAAANVSCVCSAAANRRLFTSKRRLFTPPLHGARRLCTLAARHGSSSAACCRRRRRHRPLLTWHPRRPRRAGGPPASRAAGAQPPSGTGASPRGSGATPARRVSTRQWRLR